jgi:exopolyphosphatase/guanosine-5'-triphosphate,3'-diphosphate pyrophosphatase
MGDDRATNIAAIDAGSNAIRLLIARAQSPDSYHAVKNERAALRLGHNAFTRREIDSATINAAVQVFRRFKSQMNHYDVQRYRAVATSAAREARNRQALVDAVFRTSGIRLEVIDAAEEATLVRSAVLAAMREHFVPRMIVDLGGGSLQISHLERSVMKKSVSLPLGTVRLMESFGINGALTPEQVRRVRERTLAMLRRYLPGGATGVSSPAVWSGGNAEALALIAPGQKSRGIPTVDLRVLQRKLTSITKRDVEERMDKFLVRKDRAEVMPIAAIVLLTLGQWWKLDQAFVPGVGVKEGVLGQVLTSLFGAGDGAQQPERALESARRFAALLHYDESHCEHVRVLALSIFDQLKTVHGMGGDMRSVLELSALLHDIGHVVRRDGHHKHGEYLVRNAELPGLAEPQRDILACVVRYHSLSEPNPEHKVFASLRNSQQRDIRALVSILRIADRLDTDHRQVVRAVRVRQTGRGVFFGVRMQRASELVLWEAQRGAQLFEKDFGKKVHIERIA